MLAEGMNATALKGERSTSAVKSSAVPSIKPPSRQQAGSKPLGRIVGKPYKCRLIFQTRRFGKLGTAGHAGWMTKYPHFVH
jgi:hypothetical protein